MAGDEVKKKKLKRKHKSSDVTEQVQEEPFKILKLGESEAAPAENEFEEASPWKNLQLILSLQDKNNDLLKRIDMAFDYVKSSSINEIDDVSRCFQAVNASRTLVFVNNWIQSVLISSAKTMRVEEKICEVEVPGSYLDLRCWKILHFCLEKSKDLHFSLPCLRDLLRVIRCIVLDALSHVKNPSFSSEGTPLAEKIELYNMVVDCISLIFSFHGGIANENLDSWIFLMDKVLELIVTVYTNQLDDSQLGNFVLRLTHCLFEPFAKFLKVHPTRKNGFRDFIDKLLEPLLHILSVLHSSSCSSNVELSKNLFNLVEEILAQGLFHSTHIDGFLSLQNTRKYQNSSDVTVKEENMVNKSYHRHLFDKIEKLVSEKKCFALVGLGGMLHVFVNCVTKHRGTGGPGQSDGDRTMVRQKNSRSLSVNSELRNSIFDYFVQIMEYLLADVHKYLQPEMEMFSVLSNVCSMLRSISNLIASFSYDKVYLRTEDISEGAFKNFLRLIYDTVVSFSTKITHLQTSFSSVGKSQSDLLISVRKEIIVTIHHLLDIEYEVIGDDLQSLWAVVFSSAACSYSSMDVLDQKSFYPDILSLGCKLVDLYSELRQVNSSVFALCRAARHTVLLLGESESCSTSHNWALYANSLSKLLCSLKFRISLSNAIKAIPEGQAAGFIRQLSSDIMESLEWIKFEHLMANTGEITIANPNSRNFIHFDVRAEVLGRVLSDVYTIIIDSISVSSGNSYLFGVSLKNSIEILRPGLSRLVSALLDPAGRSLSYRTQCEKASICWILVFFFRSVLSYRCLFQQVVSLMSPDALKKLSEVKGYAFTAYSWKDWLEMFGSADKGFSALTLFPSTSLLSVIRSVSDNYIQDSGLICSPLVYVLHSLALQRLVDLNRLIKSCEYMDLWNQTQGQTETKDSRDSASYSKKTRKCKKHVSEMRDEAAGLTEFLLGFVSSVDKDQMSHLSIGAANDDAVIHSLHGYDTPDFALGSLDEKLLPLTLWWIVCYNVDIWCVHAAKKDLKRFLTLLIQVSVSCVSDHDVGFGIFNTDKPGHLKFTARQIALKFLSNTISHEQGSIRRYMTSRFCRILQNLVLSIYSTAGVDISNSPDWVEVMSAVEHLSDVQVGGLTWKKQIAVLPELCGGQTNVEFITCQCLLTLLMQMPQEYISMRSSSLYITSILNLERLLVGSMLGWYMVSSSHSPYEIFRLFVSCRRALKVVTEASCKKIDGSQSQLASRLSESSFPLFWLLKSLRAVNGFQLSLQQDIAFESKVAMFSLMNYTSNVFLAVSRDQFEYTISSVIKLHQRRKLLDPCIEESNVSERYVQSEKSSDARKTALQLTETLDKHMQNSLADFKDAAFDRKEESLAGFYKLNNLTSVIACSQGLLWGLSSALGKTSAVDNSNTKKNSRYLAELMAGIDPCVFTCITSMTFLVKTFFLEEDPTLDLSMCGGNTLGKYEPSSGGCDVSGDASDEGKMHPTDKKGNLRRNFNPVFPDIEAFLSKTQSAKQCIKKSLLLGILRGENAELALFLQQLFITCSAIMRLNLLTEVRSTSWDLFAIVVGISHILLSEFSISRAIPHPFMLYCLDGVVTFLEELGSYFPQIDPLLSRDFYVKLVDLHIRAIGRCIVLQGKEARLASHGTGSQLTNQVDNCLSLRTNQLGKLSARLRISFKTYVKESSELHLLSVIEAVERALVGLQDGLAMNYEIIQGSLDGGEVSPVVAAGIDCLDLILEFVTGHKRATMIKSHIQSLVACLFNIILHLQAPIVFYGCVGSIKDYVCPDPGSVVLMCVETLASISAKPSFFQIDTCHIAQCLRVPGALFKYFLNLQLAVKAATGMTKSNIAVDQKFSVELYAGCCRLLCTAVKHHKNESQQCMALLQDSVNVLLHCLEIVNINLVAGRDSSAWDVQEAVKCASSLRRVYEEVCQQKDIFGHSSFQFLSSYIWVYCGFGPARRGIIREIDEALKPGICALIDACSSDDLQLIHTTFGEGPLRSTLAALQHDYKLNYKYEGKV